MDAALIQPARHEGGEPIGQVKVERLVLDDLRSPAERLDAADQAWTFDGTTSSTLLDPRIPTLIGHQDFSLRLDIRFERQATHTGYILEHRRASP